MTFSRVRNALAAGAAMLSMTVTVLVPAPAYAQFGGVVYDPTNYSQNILTAARTLTQINNQIKSLQNEATTLINQASNLTTLPLTVLAPCKPRSTRPNSFWRKPSAWLMMSSRSKRSLPRSTRIRPDCPAAGAWNRRRKPLENKRRRV